MKKKIRLAGLLLILIMMVGCKKDTRLSDTSSNETSSSEVVQLNFLQMPYINDAQNDKGDSIGYYFENRIIKKTVFTYDKGHYLSNEEINAFRKNSLNYDVPELNGDGYWSFTFFTTKLNEQTGLSTDYLNEQYLNNDITIYYAIYG